MRWTAQQKYVTKARSNSGGHDNKTCQTLYIAKKITYLALISCSTYTSTLLILSYRWNVASLAFQSSRQKEDAESSKQADSLLILVDILRGRDVRNASPHITALASLDALAAGANATLALLRWSFPSHLDCTAHIPPALSHALAHMVHVASIFC